MSFSVLTDRWSITSRFSDFCRWHNGFAGHDNALVKLRKFVENEVMDMFN